MSRKVQKDGPTSSDAHVNAPSADMAIRYQLGDTKERGDTTPIKECTLPEGGKGFKYGDSGKCYANRSDAEAQAAAMYASGYVGKKFEAIKKSGSDDDIAQYFMDQESIAAYEYNTAAEYVECPVLKAILAEHRTDELQHYKELSEWRRMKENQPEEEKQVEPEVEEEAKPEVVEAAESYSKSYTIQICKMADNVVYGVVLAPDKADLQGDIMNKEDIESASHEYMKEYRTINIDHEKDVDAYPVESWIAKEDGMLGERKYVKGSWLMGTLLPQDLADKVRKGIYNAYSIEGTGVRTSV